MRKENYIGSIIKEIRLQKGLTQKELANNLCSIRQLTRIENNESSPTAYLLSEFFYRLGYDLYDYLPYSDDPKAFSLCNEIRTLYDLFQCDQHEQIMQMITDSKILKQATSLYAKKEIAWFKGAISNYLNIHLNITPDYYMAIILEGYVDMTLSDLLKLPLKPIEYKLMNSMIVQYLQLDLFDQAKDLLVAIIDNYEYHINNQRDPVYVRFIYNLARLHLEVNELQEAQAIAGKGIEFCVNKGLLSYLGDLANIYGRTVYKLGNHEEGQKYLMTYTTLSTLIDPSFDYRETIRILNERYNLNTPDYIYC